MEIEQFWFGDSHNRQLGVLRKPDMKNEQKGIVFFPGLAETKAGPAFLFTRMAQHLAITMPVLQFDYPCWGDSEGDMEESSLDDLVDGARRAVTVLQQCTGCKQFIFIGNGVGNWIAAKIGQWYPQSALVMILPYYSPFVFECSMCDPIMPKKDVVKHMLIDTGRSDQWQRGGAMRTLFRKLGADHYTAKGIVIRQQLLQDIADIDAGLWLKDYAGHVLEFHAHNQRPLALLAHQQSMALPFEDSHLTNPRNCDFVVEQTCIWVKKECESTQ